MRYRIASHAVNARSSVHLIDAIGVTQRASDKLSGSGCFLRAEGAKSELTARAYHQQSADHSLLSHAHADQGVRAAVLFQKLHHHYIVVERIGCAHDLDEV